MNTKICPRCKIEKDILDFGICKSRKDHLSYYCKACHNKATTISRRKSLLDPNKREKKNTYSRKLYKKNPEKYRLRSRNRSKVDIRKAIIKSRYGITLEQYDQLLKKQNGVCAICGNFETRKDNWSNNIRRLHIDHDHISGRVRGLLCSNCNNGIGHLKDNIEILEKAINYLKTLK